MPEKIVEVRSRASRHTGIAVLWDGAAWRRLVVGF
jgi:hypothetical protein